MKKMTRILFLLVFSISLFTTEGLEAQELRFKAGGIIGLNAAQIDGDRSGGFNKLGLLSGIRAVAVIKEKVHLSTEIVFSQRGAQPGFQEGNATFPFDVRLNFVEVPVIFNYLDWYQEKDDYYKVAGYFGLSYARLINSEVDDAAPNSLGPLEQLEPFFKENEINWLIGANFFATKHIGFSLRYTRAFNFLFTQEEGVTPNARALRSYFVSLSAIYMIN